MRDTKIINSFYKNVLKTATQLRR